MAKNTPTTTKPKASVPHFDRNTVVSTPSMVVDAEGDAWWIDPITKTIAPVG